MKRIILLVLVMIGFMAGQINAMEMEKNGPEKDGPEKGGIEREIEALMKEKTAGIARPGEQIRLKARKIEDPLDSPFNVYRVSYLRKKDNEPKFREFGSVIVNTVTAGGKEYIISGKIWDVGTKKEMQGLWIALSEKREILYDKEHLFEGTGDEPIKIAMFTDYECVFCKGFSPKLMKYAREKKDVCLYVFNIDIA